MTILCFFVVENLTDEKYVPVDTLSGLDTLLLVKPLVIPLVLLAILVVSLDLADMSWLRPLFNPLPFTLEFHKK